MMEPTDGLHVLRNPWTQRSRIGMHCQALASGLEDALRATRLTVPRRPRRQKSFSIDVPTHGGRKGLEHINPKSEERTIEQQLHLTYGPAGTLGSTSLWERLVAFQVPLFEVGRRNDWGHIDLLALDVDGHPIVIELNKRPPHPHRGLGDRRRRGGELAGAVAGDPRDVCAPGAPRPGC